MNKTNIVIEDAVYNNPQLLLALDNAEEIGLLYLPYSTGIELECFKKETYNLAAFEAIPNIMAVNVDDSEQRYRIPNGIKGLVCLYNLCETLTEHSLLNRGSGLHYHVDFTDKPQLINSEYLDRHKEWILEELETWNYRGTFNTKDVYIDSRAWVRFCSGNYSKEKITMEVRIGEMSFSYSILAKRIIHCNKIAQKIKLNGDNHINLMKLKAILEKNKNQSKSDYEINKIVNNRVVKYTY